MKEVVILAAFVFGAVCWGDAPHPCGFQIMHCEVRDSHQPRVCIKERELLNGTYMPTAQGNVVLESDDFTWSVYVENR